MSPPKTTCLCVLAKEKLLPYLLLGNVVAPYVAVHAGGGEPGVDEQEAGDSVPGGHTHTQVHNLQSMIRQRQAMEKKFCQGIKIYQPYR